MTEYVFFGWGALFDSKANKIIHNFNENKELRTSDPHIMNLCKNAGYKYETIENEIENDNIENEKKDTRKAIMTKLKQYDIKIPHNCKTEKLQQMLDKYEKPLKENKIPNEREELVAILQLNNIEDIPPNLEIEQLKELVREVTS